MNVVVIPDGAMIIVPLIEKNGHTYLSPTNFSKYNNEVNLDPDFKVNLSSETPSGVRGRISLLIPLLEKADAAIVLGQRPAEYEPMVLKLAYPTTRDEIIDLITKVNLFLKDFDSSVGDDLDCDLVNKCEKVSLDEFKKIIG